MMPIYEFFCEKCNVDFDRYLPLTQYKDPQTCDNGHLAKKKFSRPYIINRFEAYESPITGRPVTSEKQRREDLAQSGCIEYEPGMREDADSKVIQDERKLERDVDQTVGKLVSEMSSEKLQNLENELGNGADIMYERRGGE